MGIKVAMAAFEAVAIGAVTSLLRRAGLAGGAGADLRLEPAADLGIRRQRPHRRRQHRRSSRLSLIAGRAARRQALAGGVLALAVLCKFLPAAVSPAFWRRWDWRFGVAGGSPWWHCTRVYASAGRTCSASCLATPAEEGLETGSGFVALRWLAHLVGRCQAGRKLGLSGGWSAPGCWRWPPASRSARRCRRAGPPASRVAGRQAAVLATATTVALSPHYPWYFGWVALLACLAPYRSVFFLSASRRVAVFGPVSSGRLYRCCVRAAPRACRPRHHVGRRTPSTGSGRR